MDRCVEVVATPQQAPRPGPFGPGPDLTLCLDGTVQDPARCRALLAAWLPAGADRDVVLLVTSELVTNAVLHGAGERELRVTADGAAIRIGVVDRSTARPRRQRPRPDEPTGRGLELVERLSADWGVVVGDGLQEVWAVVAARDAAPPIPAVARAAPVPVGARPLRTSD